MTRLFRWEAFPRPADRPLRLVWVVLAGTVALLLWLWEPARRPGPVLCWFRLAFALPCPLCGGTRGVSLGLHGRFTDAIRHNPLSGLVLALGVAMVLLWCAEYLRGQRLRLVWSRRGRFLWQTACGLALLATWVYLVRFRREDSFANSWLGQLVAVFW